ncbi:MULTISPECIES: hypothetical protein [unclassified Myroides]|uniref:hypothetical protein n=1 Tax=unclassified Myroides TaxID=2642485 RepID=UPI003D2F88D9
MGTTLKDFIQHSPKYRIPYQDQTDLTLTELKEKMEKEKALVFGYALQDMPGGQTKVGFAIMGYEEAWQPNPRFVIDAYVPTFIATLSVNLNIS